MPSLIMAEARAAKAHKRAAERQVLDRLLAERQAAGLPTGPRPLTQRHPKRRKYHLPLSSYLYLPPAGFMTGRIIK